MKENICTIPINDIFKYTQGCPVCRMYNLLEQQYVEYITGAAMMSPEIRVETNKKGFCNTHYNMMSLSGPKLSTALLLQTHLDEIRNNLIKDDNSSLSKKQIESIHKLNDTCYVCERIEYDINHLLRTVFAQYAIDESFRKLYESQEYLCLNHYSLIMEKSMEHDGIPKKAKNDFYIATNKLCKNYIDSLYNDVTHFTTMYDYRNQGGDWGNSKDSIERSIAFLK